MKHCESVQLSITEQASTTSLSVIVMVLGITIEEIVVVIVNGNKNNINNYEWGSTYCGRFQCP